MIIEGDISVKAALLGNKRHIQTIYIDQKRHDKDAHFVRRIALEKEVLVKEETRESIDEMANGKTHGGMIALCEGRTYDSLEDCFQTEVPFVVLLEGVEDPFNFGGIIRSLYTAGCTGLLMKKRNWQHVEPIILKASAGASEYLPIVMSEDLEKDIDTCVTKGCYVYAAMRKDAIVYDEANYTIPTLLMIGGEMRGLSSRLLAKANQNIYIPYANDFRNALSANGACAVLGYEVFRQRRKQDGSHTIQTESTN